MNENSSPQGKLTLDDLNRFLSVPSEEIELGGHLRAAAVLSAFDPFELNPVRGEAVAASQEMIVKYLLPLCEPLSQGAERGRWTLSLTHRREALRSLATRERMKEALEANPERQCTPVQRIFERLLDGESLKLDELSRDELAALLEIEDWIEDILDGLPERLAVRQAMARADVLAPMQRLAGHGFVGREKELEQLEQYVFGPKPDMPLFVFGTGGVGKSTLLARFVLAHAAPQGVAISYIDIDRPVIRPEQPLTLLLEWITQLYPQLDVSASVADSLIKEATYAMSRSEGGRSLESAAASDYMGLVYMFGATVEQWLNGRTALLIVDTLEEAQFLGSDVMLPLIESLMSLNSSLENLRIILSGRTLPEEYTDQAFDNIIRTQEETIEDSAFLDQIEWPLRPVNLTVLQPEPARQLLKTALSERGVADISDEDAEAIIALTSRNPMCLKLAARLLQEEGIEKLRTERSELFAKLKAEKIQALLYGRILRHLHDEDVRKVAYPGLIVRRINPDIIREVLAEPCKLELSAERNEYHIFNDLSKEVALVYTDYEDGSLRHRADVRRSMLEDLTDHVEPSVIENININAVNFYMKQNDAVGHAEEIYHRLRLGHDEELLNSRWNPDAVRRLQSSLDELPPQQRLWLAERLNVTLDESARQAASQEEWESQAARSADRYLVSRRPEEALKVLHERKTRAPRSRLYGLEAEAYRFMEKYEEALTVARAGVEVASEAGAIDMALDLLLKMVVIEEARGNLKAAETLLHEAAAVSAHSSNKILQVRVQVTGLRLQRELRPDARDERAALRQEVQQNLGDDMLRKLREHPVLLREVAAELGKQDAQLIAAALETLGVEVSTDAQAHAFARAVAKIGEAEQKVKTTVTRTITDFTKFNEPDEIRKWASQKLTRRDTQRLSNVLASEEEGSKVLSSFREYFRAGVKNALKGKYRSYNTKGLI